MEQSWTIALKKLFQYFTPVVVGYGGNDGSLMDMLADLNSGDIAGRMVWCYREGSPPPGKAMAVLSKHKGVQVKIAGFDEFMLQLAAKLVDGFDVSAIAERTAKLGEERASRYREQAEKLRESSARGSPAEQKAGAVLSDSVRAGSTWWAWELKAKAAPDLDARQRVYQEGLQQFPKSAELAGNYANFLAGHRKDYDGAEALYKTALELDPSHAIITGNYANFLADQRNDYDGAEAQYKKALELNPNDANNICNYATFLADQRKDNDGAEALYKKAIELDPSSAHITGIYAIFLASERKDYGGADSLFKKAIELDPSNAHITGNYANFLANERKDYDGADSLFKKALELDPNHANNLVNYASLLLTLGSSVSLQRMKLVLQRVFALIRPPVTQALAEGLLYGALRHELAADDDEVGSTMLARLKGALLAGYPRESWDFSPMFEAVLPRLPESRRSFFQALGDAILDAEKVPALDAMEPWRELPAVDPFAS